MKNYPYDWCIKASKNTSACKDAMPRHLRLGNRERHAGLSTANPVHLPHSVSCVGHADHTRVAAHLKLTGIIFADT